jgi:hypothetical protein
MKQTLLAGVICTTLTLIPASAEVDCLMLSMTVKHSVATEQSKVLEIVATQVSAAPGCACEIVKAAIEGSNAKPTTVAAIVETAVTAAPEQMRLISQCAVAVAPDALPQVQAVLAKLDPNSGKSANAHSAKDVQDAKAPIGEVASMPNPLDFPQQGPSGPLGQNSNGTGNGTGTSSTSTGALFGGQGGQPLIPIFPPIIVNPPEIINPPSDIINPPVVTTIGPT